MILRTIVLCLPRALSPLPVMAALAAGLLSSAGASTYELSGGEVKITAHAEPDKVAPSADFMLKVIIDAPAHLKVVIPDLRTRFTGFSLAETFSSEPVVENGHQRQTQQWRLVPEPSAPHYRLAPFAVETLDQRVSPPRRQTFATKAVKFSDEGARPSVTGDPEVVPKPDWIPPTGKTVALWVLYVILGIVALAGILYGLTLISRRVKEYKMTPIERAMAELQRLLMRNLPSKGLYKDFYIELTMVVRRYIERTHGIHAPEQTTQEFLAAASNHPRFKPEILAQLRIFLESADLVKFAGQEATPAMADDATQKAKRYIENDAQVKELETPTKE